MRIQSSMITLATTGALFLLSGCFHRTPYSMPASSSGTTSSGAGGSTSSSTTPTSPTSPTTSSGSSTTTATLQPTFASIYVNISQPKCISCHNATTLAGNYDMTSYTTTLANSMVVPFNPTTSPLYLRVADNTMPPGSPLSAAEQAAISQWITNGALNDGTVAPPVAPTPTPIPLTASYQSIAQNILFPKCLSCHNATLARSGYSYADYNSTLTSVVPGKASSSPLYNSLFDGMPQGASPLSNTEKTVIMQWINAGALNN